MTTDHDAVIAAAQAQHDDAMAKLDALRSEFVNNMGPFIQQLMEAGVKYEVQQDHERTKAMGPSALKDLKDQLKHWQNRATELAVQYLDKDSLWVHRSKHLHDSGLTFDRSDVEEAVRMAAGQVSQLLSNFGYTRVMRYDSWKSQNGKLRYPGSLVFAKPDLEILKLYPNGLANLKSAYRQVEIAKNAKETEEAGELWDKA